jgi:acetoin utilization protein AcuB
MQVIRYYEEKFEHIYINDNYSKVVEKFSNNISIDSLVILRSDQTLYNIILREELTNFKDINENTKIYEIIDPVEFFLYDDDLIEDAVNIMSENKIKTLPVVDVEMYPLGLFGFYQLIKAFQSVAAMDEPGTKVMIILDDLPGQLNTLLNVLSKENVNILSLITNKLDNKKRSVTLKFNVKDVNLISEIFEKNGLDYETIFEEDINLSIPGGNF